MPKPGLLGCARPMLELFLRDSQRRQAHVARLEGGRAAWGARFEFPVSLPGAQWPPTSRPAGVLQGPGRSGPACAPIVLPHPSPLLGAEHQELTVILYDYSDFAPNDEMGRAQLPLRDLAPGQERGATLLLQGWGAKATCRGGRAAGCCIALSAPGAAAPLSPALMHVHALVALPPPAAEEHHEREKQQLGAADRIALALGRPFTKRGGSTC